jgi:hypothetical protein
MSPARLLPLVDDHIRSGRSFLRDPLDVRARRRLAAALAESQLLAGRLLFFDLQSPDAASPRFRDAVDLADEAEDGLLSGAALAHAGFVPGFAGRTDEATALLDGAEARLRDGAAWPVAGWLASVRAEVAALGGDVEASRAALARAEELLDGSLSAPAPPWFDWFNQPRLESFAGYCLLRARHSSPAGATARREPARLARDKLLRALRGLDGNAAAKQQGVVLADLADAHLELGDLPEACTAVGAAGSVARATEYAMAGTRVRAVRDRLRRRWGREPMVRELDALLTL